MIIIDTDVLHLVGSRLLARLLACCWASFRFEHVTHESGKAEFTLASIAVFLEAKMTVCLLRETLVLKAPGDLAPVYVQLDIPVVVCVVLLLDHDLEDLETASALTTVKSSMPTLPSSLSRKHFMSTLPASLPLASSTLCSSVE